MLVAPSDHVVPDGAAFLAAVDAGVPTATADRIVTFGISPDRPETGYGYLELAAEVSEGQITDLRRFVEKPDHATAEAMLAKGNYLWNAGIFLFCVRTILAAFETQAPDLIPPVSAAVETAKSDLGFLRLAPEPWAQAQDVSIDFAVMEKASDLAVVPFTAGWSDLGDWDAIWRVAERDGRGVGGAGRPRVKTTGGGGEHR